MNRTAIRHNAARPQDWPAVGSRVRIHFKAKPKPSSPPSPSWHKRADLESLDGTVRRVSYIGLHLELKTSEKVVVAVLWTSVRRVGRLTVRRPNRRAA